MKKLLIIISLLILSAPAFASDVTLRWEKPDDNRVVGYNIYYGTDWQGFINPTLNISSADQTSVVITDLEEGQRYDFGATAVADNGNESDMSEIVSYFVIGYKPGKITITIED